MVVVVVMVVAAPLLLQRYDLKDAFGRRAPTCKALVTTDPRIFAPADVLDRDRGGGAEGIGAKARRASKGALAAALAVAKLAKGLRRGSGGSSEEPGGGGGGNSQLTAAVADLEGEGDGSRPGSAR